jgi:hypothetical protein
LPTLVIDKWLTNMTKRSPRFFVKRKRGDSGPPWAKQTDNHECRTKKSSDKFKNWLRFVIVGFDRLIIAAAALALWFGGQSNLDQAANCLWSTRPVGLTSSPLINLSLQVRIKPQADRLCRALLEDKLTAPVAGRY